MYFADHGPAHVHVEYQGHEALVGIADGELVQGALPRRVQGIVAAWCLDHRQELEDNWARAQALLPLSRVSGADND